MNIPDKYEDLIIDALETHRAHLKDEARLTISQQKADRANAKADTVTEVIKLIEASSGLYVRLERV